jgi:CBS domain-containing protein
LFSRTRERDKVFALHCRAVRAFWRKKAMTQICDLVKDRRVYSVNPDTTVLEAARLMMEHNIGALPVLRDGGLAGIFSERDIMNRVVALGRMPGTTKVSEVMTPNPKSVTSNETVENSLFLMREFGFRHLPIMDDGELKGLVSLRDVLMRYFSQKDAEGRRKAS